MTKTEFTALLAHKNGLQVPRAERLLNAVLDSLEDALALDGRIGLPGLGVFLVKTVPERDARNPATGETIKMPASKTVKFRPAASLKQALE